MADLFKFGEEHPAYLVRVLNEREARGAAGIMFLFALIAFMQAWFKGDFAPTKLTIVAFFMDFFIRVLVNPRYAPTLIMARWMVNNQTPEYVGAPQKRFAWAIGLGLATLMMYLVVLHDVRGPINMVTCLLCLVLLFFETAFGICIGCKLYNLFNKGSPRFQCSIDLVHIPFKGIPEALADTMAGRTHLFISPYASAINLVREGKAKAIAVTSTTRFADMPNLPTVAESGVPGYKWIFWYGLLAPANTPKDIVQKLQTEVVAALKQPQVTQRFTSLGIDAVTSTPEAMDQLIKDEIVLFRRLATAAGIKAD